MKHSPTILIALALAAPLTGRAADVVGTAYSVLLRSDAPEAALRQPPAAPPGRRPVPVYPGIGVRSAPLPAAAVSPLMRLINGRTGAELAQGRYDVSLRGYFFALPMKADLSRGDVCLVLKNAEGRSLPVRDESRGDDGYAFRNPLWETELRRQGDLVDMGAELAHARQQLGAAEKELAELDRVAGATPLPTTPQACMPGPERPEPPRPPVALAPEQIAAQSGGLCAVRWHAQLGELGVARPAIARFFRDAGLEAEMQAAEAAGPLSQAMQTLKLRPQPQDLSLLKDAASRGSAFLQHAQGVARLRQLMLACRTDAADEARRAVVAWEQDRLAAQNAPALAKADCERRVGRRLDLQRRIAAGNHYASELSQRIEALNRGAPTATESTDVGRLACREN